MNKTLSRLSLTLLWRGAAMMALGMSAVIWPSQLLVVAMIVVSIVSTLLGVYELSLAASIRRLSPRWWLVLAHGLASVGFGVLTAGIPGVTIRGWLIASAGWLLCYAGIAWSAAVLVKPTVALRRALAFWGLVDLALAILAVASPDITILDLLFAGAAYAAVFGVWQLSVGSWLGRQIRQMSTPSFAPSESLTIQSRH